MFTAAVSYAQQDAQFTQYMYNTINVNPAYAGSRGAMSIFALHRSQWVGLDGAPTLHDFVDVPEDLADPLLHAGTAGRLGRRRLGSHKGYEPLLNNCRKTGENPATRSDGATKR